MLGLHLNLSRGSQGRVLGLGGSNLTFKVSLMASVRFGEPTQSKEITAASMEDVSIHYQ